MSRERWRQVLDVFRMEIRKSFFARRSLWIYLLAMAPFLLFVIYGIQTRIEHGQMESMQAQNQRPLQESDFDSIKMGMSHDDVVRHLGKPPRDNVFRYRRRDASGAAVFSNAEILRYSDGVTLYSISLRDDKVIDIESRKRQGLGDLTQAFAGQFQFFYLRLAVFFGCLGIFMNLFRGELLDKSLHFYFLTPLRREVVMLGKFLAGLTAAIAIFVTSVALQLITLGWELDANSLNRFLTMNHGASQIASYLGVTALACVGYGALFLAAGLMFRNPILPTAVILIWESLNPFLPALLKKFSVIYYLKALCPFPVTANTGLPALFKLLVSNPDPISAPVAVFGVLAVAALVLWACAHRVRRFEIDYTAE